MERKQKRSWEITDEFWAIAEPLIPKKTRNPDKKYQRKPGAGRRLMEPRMTLEAIFFVLQNPVESLAKNIRLLKRRPPVFYVLVRDRFL
jgi:hypothetical protein